MFANADDRHLLKALVGAAAMPRLESRTLGQLLEADSAELAALGLPSRARRVLLAGAEVARRHQPALGGARCINAPRHALPYLHDLRGGGTEVMAVLLLDCRLAPLGVERVAEGSVAHVAATPADVFGPALRRRASAIVLAHNHPSGRAEPSLADVEFTRGMVEAGRVLDVRLLDHLVLARRAYFSFVEAGLL